MQKSSAGPRKTFRILFPWALQGAAALAGIILSILLLVEHTRLKRGFQGSTFCSIGNWADCNSVNASGYSEIFGIPLAAIGAVYFFTLLALSAFSRPFLPSTARAQAIAARLVAAGLLVDVALFFVQAFAIHKFCLLCLSTYVCSFVYFVTDAWLVAERLGHRFFSFRWCRMLFVPEPKSSKIPSQAKAIAVFAGLLYTLAILLVPAWAVPSAPVGGDGTKPEVALENLWRTATPIEIPMDPLDGTLGNAEARVRLVVFSDFECPHCKHAAAELHQVVDPMQRELFLVFKNFPLDNHCNPALTFPMHPNACAFAQLGACAARQKKFWPFHDTVYFRLQDTGLQNGIETYMKPLADVFTPEDFRACLKDGDAEAKIRRDAQFGYAQKIHSTPTLYINGKKAILPITAENVRTMIRWEQNLTASK